MWPFLIFFITVVIICVVKLLTKNHDYFEKRGMKFFKPYPLIGTNYWIVRREALAYDMLHKCQELKNEKIFGTFEFLAPITVINDPDLIKQVTIKDFEYFTDHRTPFNPKSSKVVENLLINLKGKKWYEMRTSLTPIFTSSKMRLMLELVQNCAKQLVEHLKADQSKSGKSKTYEMKDIFSKYACDVISSCAFGYQSDSFQDPSNQFYELGKGLLQFGSPMMLVKMLLMRFTPMLAKILRVSLFDPKAALSFYNLIVDTISKREDSQISRPDLINSLVQIKRGTLINEDDRKGAVTKRTWNNDELVAQCFTFFFAGFDTISNLLLFATYEIAVNPDIQSRLRDEINEAQEDLGNGNPVTYDVLKRMKYMDMVVSEALRKWPPAPILDRVCTKAYNYENDGVKLRVDEDERLLIPVYSVHHNPDYYPDPEKFDPERFSEENKSRLVPNTYLPFGIGPRNCIGSRFALMEIKTILFYLLSGFRLELSKETEVPVKLKCTAFGMVPHNPILLNLIPLET